MPKKRTQKNYFGVPQEQAVLRFLKSESEEEKNKILQAIKDAENNTSGEIRLHLDSKCKGDALAQGIKIFQRLKMHKTALRNGTLIFLAVDDKKFAIVGDEGINKIVDDNFWDDVREQAQIAGVDPDDPAFTKYAFHAPSMRLAIVEFTIK